MSGITLKVQFDTAQFGTVMNEWRDQTNYALATAINNTAIDMQKAVREQLSHEFTLRNQYAKQSIKIKPFAKKTSLTATVGVSPPGGGKDILSLHEEGGTKVSMGNGDVAIPQKFIRPSPETRITTSKLPRNLTGAFVITKSDGTRLIMVRRGRGKHSGLKVAYLLKKETHIRPDLGFIRTAITTIDARWTANCEAAWSKAIASARPGEAPIPTSN